MLLHLLINKDKLSVADLPPGEHSRPSRSAPLRRARQRIRNLYLPPGEHSRPSRSAPLRRARQRIRNLCTML
uniref:Bm9017 n=1 Tax=Brugia malayi TaxID=6279 RepID=A0A1I9G6Q6_BRUMA|nr:Bm9017 [Brugia malayi]